MNYKFYYSSLFENSSWTDVRTYKMCAVDIQSVNVFLIGSTEKKLKINIK